MGFRGAHDSMADVMIKPRRSSIWRAWETARTLGGYGPVAVGSPTPFRDGRLRLSETAGLKSPRFFETVSGQTNRGMAICRLLGGAIPGEAVRSLARLKKVVLGVGRAAGFAMAPS